MTPMRSRTPAPVLVEIDHRILRILDARGEGEWPLERTATGGLTPACAARIGAAVRTHLGRRQWQPRLRAWCALSGRGVSLRRLVVPSAAPDALPGVLALQVENEFPLPPDALCWGYTTLGASGAPPSGSAAPREVLIAAVKREVIAEYAALLTQCGLEPQFTPAALARMRLVPASRGPATHLHLGTRESEYLVVDQHGPQSLRVIAWGLETAPPRDESDERLKLQAAATSLATALPRNGTAKHVLLSGSLRIPSGFAPFLADQLGAEVTPLETSPSPASNGHVANPALTGLKTASDRGEGASLPWLRIETRAATSPWSRPSTRKLAAIAALLLLAWLSIPFVEAMLLRPRLSAKLAALKAEEGRLALIDRDVDFLRYLRTNQPPYLEALQLLGSTFPPGSQLQTITMNRQGDLTLAGSVRTSQEIVDFRTKLVESGFFTSVVVGEQTPTPDRQKINVRLHAKWKPGVARPTTPPPAQAATR